MPASGATSALQPHRHCALCPSPTFPQLAALPDLSQWQVYPVTASPLPPTATESNPTRPPTPPAPAPPLPHTTPPPAAGVGSDAAEALLLFFSQAPQLEAALAALPGIQFFDWQPSGYVERGGGASAPPATADGIRRSPTGEPQRRGRPQPDRQPVYTVPTPMYLQFHGLQGKVLCDLPPAQPLWQALRLPAVRAVRASGGYRISLAQPQSTPPRGVSFARPTATPQAGTTIPAEVDPAQVGLRFTPASADADAVSRALLIPLPRLPELLDWLLTTPPIRWHGLLFGFLPDAVWIDNAAAAETPLPPLLQVDRLTPRAGSIGASLWLQSGTAWSPPLAADLILERLQALPGCDYILRPDLSGALRCRYILERSRLQPLTRAALQLAAAEANA